MKSTCQCIFFRFWSCLYLFFFVSFLFSKVAFKICKMCHSEKICFRIIFMYLEGICTPPNCLALLSLYKLKYLPHEKETTSDFFNEFQTKQFGRKIIPGYRHAWRKVWSMSSFLNFEVSIMLDPHTWGILWEVYADSRTTADSSTNIGQEYIHEDVWIF